MFIQNGNLYICECDQLYQIDPRCRSDRLEEYAASLRSLRTSLKIEFLDRQIFLSGKITLSLEPIDHYISKQYYLFMVREHFGAIYSDHIGIDQNMTLEEIVNIFHSGMLKYLKKLISISPDNQQYLKTAQQFYEIGAHKYIESQKKIDKFNLN